MILSEAERFKRKIRESMDFLYENDRKKKKEYMIKVLEMFLLGGVLTALSLLAGNGFFGSLCLMILWEWGTAVGAVILLGKKCDEKRERAEAELPDYMDRIALLLSAGIQLRKAMIQASENDESYFSGKLRKYLEEEERTGNVEENLTLVLEKTAEKYGSGEIGSFASLIIQNMTKGSGTLVNMLNIQAELLRRERSNRIKRKGERAATYMLIPSLIIFAAILIMMTAPVIMMMNQKG